MKKILILLAATTALTACNKQSEKDSQKSLTEEQVKMIIDDYIEQHPDKIIKELNNYSMKMQMQQREKMIQEKLDNPVSFEFDDQTPVKGAEDAVVTIVEFSDFQCPYCSKVSPTLNSILKRYEGKVRLAFQHLPLAFHDNAKPAALAAIAANKQGKFWEYHDELFKNQTNLTQDTLLKIAEKLELDMEQFKADMNSEETAKKLESDIAKAKELGISGTPNFLINGVSVAGALPEEEFVKVIEKVLDVQEQ